ncbi:MAG: glycosyl transferase family 1 [Elusimicrobia bacterium]|nr:glycosyl transferase family 1 [Elusimicrobiota bacterium]
MITQGQIRDVLGPGSRREDSALAKKKVLFMPVSMSMAHVGRLVRLAQSLSLNTYDITFALEERDHRFIPALFHPRCATSLTPEECRRRLEQGRSLIDASLLRRQVEEDLALLRELRPDLVVGDFRLSLGISAPLAGVPHMNVVNAHWSPWSREVFHLPAPPEAAPFKWLGFRAGKKLADALLPVGFALHGRPFNQVRQEYGLPALPQDVRGIYTAGDHTAYADLPEMVPTPGAPASHRHIGPVLWEPTVSLPPWWGELPENKPLVYVSAGSTGRTDFLPGVLAALAERPVVVAVATSGRGSVAPVPGRVFVAEYLPGLALCRRASLVINNGGAGGVYQALTAGVPVLGIAANLDQCMVMKPVERAGAGRLVLAGEADSTPWVKVVGGLLGSLPARAAAKSFSRLLSSRSAGDVFAKWVGQILGKAASVNEVKNHKTVVGR